MYHVPSFTYPTHVGRRRPIQCWHALIGRRRTVTICVRCAALKYSSAKFCTYCNASSLPNWCLVSFKKTQRVSAIHRNPLRGCDEMLVLSREYNGTFRNLICWVEKLCFANSLRNKFQCYGIPHSAKCRGSHYSRNRCSLLCSCAYAPPKPIVSALLGNLGAIDCLAHSSETFILSQLLRYSRHI